jgi:nuclear fragile X mental retardation-interacting protein 1
MTALPSPMFQDKSPKPPAEIKPHVEARPPPKQSVAFCKYCREGFSSDNELFQHRKSHERCPYDDCKFNANAKTIAEHIQRVHIQKGNALVKIQDLTTPEQIEKWREERRKRYPTTQNVLLRQQAQEERNQRGEKLHDRKQRFGDFQQRNFIRDMDKKPQKNDSRSTRKRHHKERQPRGEKDQPKNESAEVPAKVAKVEAKVAEAASKVLAYKPAAPMKTLQAPMDSSDDEQIQIPRFRGTTHMKDYHKVETVIKEQAALSILGMYGSDSESEEGEIVEEPAVSDETSVAPEVLASIETPQEIIKTEENDQKDELEEEDPDEAEAPEEVPIEYTSELPEPQSTSHNIEKKPKQSKRDTRKQPRTVLDYSKLRKPSVNPFLEKLLQQDIRHERNVLLQCVNFVVKKNFFGVGQEKKSLEVAKVEDKTAIVEFTENL